MHGPHALFLTGICYSGPDSNFKLYPIIEFITLNVSYGIIIAYGIVANLPTLGALLSAKLTSIMA